MKLCKLEGAARCDVNYARRFTAHDRCDENGGNCYENRDLLT